VRKRLTEKEITEVAAKVKEEYEYMDTMSDEGWLWEFARRTTKYMDAFERLKNIASQKAYGEMGDVCVSLGFSAGILSTLYEAKHMFSETGFPDHKNTWEDIKGHIASLKLRGWMAITFKRTNAEAENHWCYQQINNTEEIKDYHTLLMVNPFYEMENGEDAIINFFENALLCSWNLEDTVFFGVSKKASDSDIKEIQKIIRRERRKERKEEKQKRKRPDEWKYYIVVYDLIKKEKLEPNEVVTILNAAGAVKIKNTTIEEGEEPWEYKDVNRYYREAVRLIEHEDFKKYLSDVEGYRNWNN